MTPSPHLTAADEPERVRIPPVTYVAIGGDGAPGTDEFYRKKLAVGDLARRLGGEETPVIEIQYWYPDGSLPTEISDFYTVNPVQDLEYRVHAAVPASTTSEQLQAARNAARDLVDTDSVDLLELPAADVVQVMHHGPFAEEHATLARLGAFAEAWGLHRQGPHREIHLDGFTRSTPQHSLRTILRDPVA